MTLLVEDNLGLLPTHGEPTACSLGETGSGVDTESDCEDLLVIYGIGAK